MTPSAPLAFARAALLAAALVSPRLDGANISWSLAGAGAWGTAGNWTGGVLPGTSDVAVFGLTTAGTVTLGANRSVGGLSFTGTAVTTLTSGGTADRTLTLGSSGLSVASSSVDHIIGSTSSNSGVAISLGASQTWTIGSGRILTAHNTITGTNSNLTISGTGTFTRGSANSSVVNLGTGRLIINGAVVELGTGTNTMAGLTVLSGMAVVRAASVYGSTGNVLLGDSNANSGLAQLRVANVTFSRPIQLQSGSTGTLRVDTLGNTTATVSSEVTGNNNLQISSTSAGKMTFSGALNFTGALTLSQLASGSNIPTAETRVNLTGAIGAGVTGVTISANNGLGITTLSANNSAMTGTFDIGSGRVQQTANNAVFGSGDLILRSGANVQLVTLSEGATLALPNTAITLESGSTLDLRGTSTGTVTQTYNFANLAAPIDMQGATVIFRSSGSTTKAFNGAFALSGDNVFRIESGSGDHVANLNRALTGSGTLTLRQAGAADSRTFNFASLATTGTANNFTGSLILDTVSGAATANLNQALGASTYDLRDNWVLVNNVSGGLDSATSLVIGSAAATLRLTQPTVAASAALSFTAAGKLELGASASTLGSLSGTAGTIQATGSSSALTLTQAAAGTFGGTFVATDANALALTKSGAATLTLTGASTFAGSVAVSEGILELGTGGSFSANASVASGATLALAGGSLSGLAQSVNLAGGTLDGRTGSTLGAGKTLDLGGAAALGAGTVAGNLTVDGGTLRFDITSEADRDLLTLASGATLDLTAGTLALNFTGGSLVAGTYRLIDASLGTLNVGLVDPTPAGFTVTGLPAGESRISTAWTQQEGFLNLVVSGAPGDATWNAAGAGGIWDAGSVGSANWTVTNATAGDLSRFYEGDDVVFGDTGAGTVTLASPLIAGAVSVASSADYTLEGAALQAASLSKSGTGKLTLATALTLNAGTTLAGGTLELASGGSLSGDLTITGGTLATASLAALGSGNLTLNGGRLEIAASGALALGPAFTIGGSGGSVAFTAADAAVTDSFARALAGPLTLELTQSTATATLSGVLSGTGSLTKSGAGTLTLSGTNTFAGGVTLEGGVLGIHAASALGTGSLTLEGGTLSVSGGGVAANAIGTSVDLVVDAVGDLELAGDITETVAGRSLRKSGAGTLTLSGDNTLTGEVTVTGGVLSVGSLTAIPTSGAINLAGGSIGFTAASAGLDLASRVTLADGAVSGIDVAAGASVTLSGSLSLGTLGDAGFRKTGAGTLTLAAANAHTGGTFLGSGKVNTSETDTPSADSDGTLVILTAAALGTGPLTAGGAQLRAGVAGLTLDVPVTLSTGGFRFGGEHSLTLSGAVTLSGGNRTIGHYSAAADLTVAGPVNLDTFNLTFEGPSSASTGRVEVSGVISGTGGVATLANFAGRTAVLSGASDYTGTHSIAGGTVVLAGGNTLTGGATVGAGTLRLTNGTVLNGAIALNGTGRIELAGGRLAQGLTFNASGATAVLAVTGGDNTGVGVSIGRLNSLLVEAGTLTLSGGLATSGGGGATIQVSAGATLTAATFSHNWTTPTFVVDGVLNLTGTGASAYSFGTNSAGTLAGAGTINIVGGFTTTNSGNNSNPLINVARFNLGGGDTGVAITRTYGTIRLGTSTLGIFGQDWTTASNASMQLVEETVGTTFDTLDSVDGTTGRTMTLAGALSGAGKLNKVGAGTLFLGNANTYTGATSVTGGTLRFAAGGLSATSAIAVDGATLAWAGANTNDISERLTLGAAGATLDTGANNVTFATGLAAAGNLTKAGSGTLTLAAAGSLAGALDIAAGKVVLGNASSIGAAAVSLASGATLSLGFTAASPLEFANVLTGSGTLEIATANEDNLVTFADIGGFTGSLRLVSGYVDSTGFTGGLTYVGGKLTDVSALAGSLIIEGNYLASQGLPDDILLRTGGILDFAGATGETLAANLRYTGGSLANASAFVGTVDIQVSSLVLDAGAFGSATVLLGNGLTAAVGANFTNDIRLEGDASLINDPTDFTGTLILGNLASFDLGTNPDFVRASSFRLAAGGTLRGQGSIGDLAVESGGILAPGNSPGIVNVGGDLTLLVGGTLEFEVLAATGIIGDPIAGTDYDLLRVAGELDLSSLSAANRFLLDLVSLGEGGVLSDFDPAAGYQFTLIEYASLNLGANEVLGTDLSSLFAIDTTGFLDQNGFQVASGWSVINDSTNSALVLTYAAPIPEPSTYGLALGALALAAAAIRRRRKG